MPPTPSNTSLVGFIAITGIAIIGFAVLRGAQDFLKRAMVGFTTSAGWTPVIAVIATIVALYVVGQDAIGQRGSAIILGLAAALVGWSILAFLGSFHNVPARVNTRVYSDVSEAYRTLRQRLESAADKEATSAYRVAKAHLDWLADCVGIGTCESDAKPDAEWATGYRYLDLWSATYRAEEASSTHERRNYDERFAPMSFDSVVRL